MGQRNATGLWLLLGMSAACSGAETTVVIDIGPLASHLTQTRESTASDSNRQPAFGWVELTVDGPDLAPSSLDIFVDATDNRFELLVPSGAARRFQVTIKERRSTDLWVAVLQGETTADMPRGQVVELLISVYPAGSLLGQVLDSTGKALAADITLTRRSPAAGPPETISLHHAEVFDEAIYAGIYEVSATAMAGDLPLQALPLTLEIVAGRATEVALTMVGLHECLPELDWLPDLDGDGLDCSIDCNDADATCALDCTLCGALPTLPAPPLECPTLAAQRDSLLQANLMVTMAGNEPVELPLNLAPGVSGVVIPHSAESAQGTLTLVGGAENVAVFAPSSTPGEFLMPVGLLQADGRVLVDCLVVMSVDPTNADLAIMTGSTWSDPMSWQPSVVPSSESTVFVPRGSAHSVDLNDSYAGSLWVETGAELMHTAPYLAVFGDLLVGGTLIGSSTTSLQGGDAPQRIGGSIAQLHALSANVHLHAATRIDILELFGESTLSVGDHRLTVAEYVNFGEASAQFAMLSVGGIVDVGDMFGYYVNAQLLAGELIVRGSYGMSLDEVSAHFDAAHHTVFMGPEPQSITDDNRFGSLTFDGPAGASAVQVFGFVQAAGPVAINRALSMNNGFLHAKKELVFGPDAELSGDASLCFTTVCTDDNAPLAYCEHATLCPN